MPSTARRSIRLSQAALLALLLGAARADAQNPEEEAARPAKTRQLNEQATQVSEDAAKYDAPGGEVAYEAVLADPDNPDLNYRYARQQVRKGDLKGAAATLERMLLVDPNQPRIRLFYAVVLYRLDNMVMARRELDLLAAAALPGPLASEVEGYRKLVAARLKKNHLSGRAGVGFQYDTNRNAAPAAGARLFADTPIPLSPSSQRRDDTSVVGLAGLDYRRDVGDGHALFGSANYYQAEQTLVKILNLKAYSLQGGGVYRHGRDTITPSLVFDHVLLAQSTYLRDRGVDVRYEHKVGKTGDLYVQVHDVFQDFVANAVVPTAPERTGLQFDAVVGGDYVVTPSMRVGLGYLHAWKHAAKRYNQFGRDGLLLDDVWLLGKGTFLLANATLTFDEYDQPDVALSTRYRRDTTLRASATYGLPLELAHPALKDLLLTFTYEYYQANSTLKNFGYTNNKIGTLLTYKFDLGF